MPKTRQLAIGLPTYVNRPECPIHLTGEQAKEWRTIVDSFPADFFTISALPILAQYCRHIVVSRRVADLIRLAESKPEIDLDQYEKLLKCADREGRAMAHLHRALGLDHKDTEVFIWDE